MTRMKNVERWSYVTGERGRNRVRAFAHPETGRIFLEVREPVAPGVRARTKRVALKHADREQAKIAADTLAAELRRGRPATRPALTLHTLFDIYLREVTPMKAEGTQYHDRATAKLFLRAFGKDREPSTLGLRDWHRFISERRSGRLRPKGPAHRKRNAGVGDRQVSYDLRWLLAVFRWAPLACDGKGGALLEKNPCAGFPVPSEGTPRRPRLAHERYEQMLAVADAVHPDFRLALVLARETGHRLSSIRQLRWSDVRWPTETEPRGWMRWRGSDGARRVDKQKHEHTTPLTRAAVEALAVARARTAAIGDAWIFPEGRPDGTVVGPRPRGSFAKWWEEAERAAKLEHEPGMAWHALRRAFATDLKAMPLKDLCALGGWSAPETILRCYQQADTETMTRALDERVAVAK